MQFSVFVLSLTIHHVGVFASLWIFLPKYCLSFDRLLLLFFSLPLGPGFLGEFAGRSNEISPQEPRQELRKHHGKAIQGVYILLLEWDGFRRCDSTCKFRNSIYDANLQVVRKLTRSKSDIRTVMRANTM
ncbi:hypothetical protein F4820DRAFT_365421 [Hypoxylon rubiginosum]|uniref:Uncharacterized protein n=1 Tax=Hypoxylon rubiginosum TaxID=110542 RepID=A0ACB9ZDU0_9PEZI|nr:hypothetical protein F4820DRAFT_365421 [Hypoxylon rubiginosum]